MFAFLLQESKGGILCFALVVEEQSDSSINVLKTCITSACLSLTEIQSGISSKPGLNKLAVMLLFDHGS